MQFCTLLLQTIFSGRYRLSVCTFLTVPWMHYLKKIFNRPFKVCIFIYFSRFSEILYLLKFEHNCFCKLQREDALFCIRNMNRNTCTTGRPRPQGLLWLLDAVLVFSFVSFSLHIVFESHKHSNNPQISFVINPKTLDIAGHQHGTTQHVYVFVPNAVWVTPNWGLGGPSRVYHLDFSFFQHLIKLVMSWQLST